MIIKMEETNNTKLKAKKTYKSGGLDEKNKIKR